MRKIKIEERELSGYYFDATMENFQGFAKAFPEIEIEENMFSSIRYEAYCYIEASILTWSHYNSIGRLLGTPSNKSKKKIKFDADGNIYLIENPNRDYLSSRGKPKDRLLGYKHYKEYENILKKRLDRCLWNEKITRSIR